MFLSVYIYINYLQLWGEIYTEPWLPFRAFCLKAHCLQYHLEHRKTSANQNRRARAKRSLGSCRGNDQDQSIHMPPTQRQNILMALEKHADLLHGLQHVEKRVDVIMLQEILCHLAQCHR